MLRGVTSGQNGSLHVDFDLHGKEFCEEMAEEIEKRSDIKISVYSQKTDSGIDHYKMSASTSPRALALLALMFHYAPFQLDRKVDAADKLFLRLIASVRSYHDVDMLPGDFHRSAQDPQTLDLYLDTMSRKWRRRPDDKQ